MKIKYIDKTHIKSNNKNNIKKILLYTTGIPILSVSIFTISYYAGINIYNNGVSTKIIETTYKIGDENFKIKDIYLLYKDNEIRICRRENNYNDYKFYDINTNDLIGIINYSLKSSSEIKEKDKENIMKYMNGYEYVNLGEKIKEDGFKEHYRINQYYIDDYIENKKFLLLK